MRDLEEYRLPMTNATAKQLRFIQKHQNCTFEEIQARFQNIDFMDLVNLCLTGYLVCTKPGNKPTIFADGSFFIGPKDRFWSSPKAEQFLENRLRGWLQWVIPTTISGVALILSIITLWLSQMPQVTTVRILP